jgi:alkanesulfonate monooxygenase SsuD/methylene tetrahydromethanopterin reductase-like flavin-dependent oxidoreductase (luciferase family)
VFLPVSGPFSSKKLLVEAALEAQTLGFDSVVVHDRVVQTTELHTQNVDTGSVEAARSEQAPIALDSLTTLAYLSGIAEQVEMCVSALVLPARHPLLVAKQVASVDHLSGGRLILGVCKGQRRIRSTFDSLSLPFEKRWSLFKEYVEALRELLTKDQASFNGKYVSFSDIEIYPRPKRPRILMGVGISPEGIKSAASLGDGWLPGHRPPDEVEYGIKSISAERRRIGLSRGAYEVGLNLYTGVAKTQEKAVKMASGTVLARARLGTFPGSEPDVVHRRALVGSPDYIIERVEQYEKAGVHEIFHMVVHDTKEGLAKSMKILSNEVLPSFKSH